MNNIEEDIKIVKKIIEPNYIDEWGFNILSVRTAEAIKNILNEYKKLKKILELGLDKEKQYCFNEDGNTGMCLGYGIDEPCEYCKSCEKLNVKEE